MIARAAVAALVLLLSGCVAFEHLPVAELDCDPQLVGRWLPVDEDHADDEDDAITVDNNCQALFPPPARASTASYRTTLRGFALDGWRYLVFSAGDVERIMGIEAGTLAAAQDAAFLLRYRIEGDLLSGSIVDFSDVRAAVADKRIEGRALGVPESRAVGVIDDPSLYLVESDGQATAELLRTQPELFGDDDKSLQLRRVAGASP